MTIDGASYMPNEYVWQFELTWDSWCYLCVFAKSDIAIMLLFFKMEEKLKQWVCTKFCFNLKKSVSEMYNIIWEWFEKCALSHTQVFEWYAHFKAGRTELGDDKWTPSMSTMSEIIAKIQQCIREDWHRIIHDIVTKFGIGYGPCHQILNEELGMHRVSAKFVHQPVIFDWKCDEYSPSSITFTRFSILRLPFVSKIETSASL